MFLVCLHDNQNKGILLDDKDCVKPNSQLLFVVLAKDFFYIMNKVVFQCLILGLVMPDYNVSYSIMMPYLNAIKGIMDEDI